MATITLVSINIERDKHLDLVIPFLNHHRPDVVCLQEVFDLNIGAITEATGLTAVYAPMQRINEAPDLAAGRTRMGVAILARTPLTQVHTWYYGDFLLDHPKAGAPLVPDHCVLLGATVKKGGKDFTVATTHFTWTPDGGPTPNQLRNFERLRANLNEYPELILCGDFNAARGKGVFDQLAEQYTDNIPADVLTSIDGARHYAGPLQLVVDGLFTSPAYRAEQVRVLPEVSDHCALVATIKTR